ncbi:hypothetical protein [Roseovarius aquimarinus]|uniref:Flagellar assembly protein T N-terminal domain-containing protein n=1 Tax=Roseovarius aquimarinus TaxID=1229156 RepID=A0ABW7I5X2_9RHOB
MRRWVGALLALALSALAVPSGASAGEALRVEAVGNAYVASAADRDAARRRAIAEALFSAALSGGAALKGHTVMDKGRITADLAILRPTGRILSHELVSARLDGALWTVRVSALVGPAPEEGCGARRRLIVSATPPVIAVAPGAPAWADPLAHRLALDVAALLRGHPGTQLDSVAPVFDAPVAASLDYQALTRGSSVPAPGDHRLAQSIAVEARGKTVHLGMELAFLGPDGRIDRRSFARAARVPGGGTLGYLTGSSRSAAEAALTDGILQEVRAMLDALSCEAPEARIVMSSNGLSVPIGTAHGLTRASLAFVDDAGGNFDILEITQLGARSAALRPLDPTRAPGVYHGRRVYFLEAGL